MLMRSSSTPMLHSLLPQPSPEPEFFLQMTPKSKPYSITALFSLNHDHTKKLSRNLSESDLIIRGSSTRKCSCMHARFQVPLEVEEEEEEDEDEDMGCRVEDVNSRRAAEVVVGGGGSGGGDGDDGGYGWCWDANKGKNNSMDLHYEKMIEANPQNSMLLGNYARFLKEIRGDLVKAEEYCGRAILANPNDGNVLSLYADLVWHVYEDANRANIYFDRAVKAAPENSYVMASYARFLWDAEDEIDDH